jgi:hypothetical protein
MKNPRKYGLLTENTCKELFQTINERPYCNECRAARKDFQKKDMKMGLDEKEHLGIIIPGFSSPEVLPLDILIIADSIGGGRKQDFSQETSMPLDKVVQYLGDYYLDEKVARFHQYEMRKLLHWLEKDFKKNWIFSDLVKCFVYQGGERFNGKDGNANMGKAIEHCSQYLDDQMEKLDPSVVLILGGKVAKNYCNIKGRQLRQLRHGQRGKYNRNGKDFDFVYSVFPSMWTADIWVKDIDPSNDDAWLPVKAALRSFFSTN